MSTSSDGGLTWGPRKFPGGTGIGGQPVVQPNGNVIVPYEGGAGIRSFRSIDGGATWQSSVAVATVSEHGVAGNLRTSPLPSAEVAGDGKVYVAWQDCSFRSGCTSNDIVYSTSTRRRRVDCEGADPDRRDDQRRRPLHPGLRRRPLDVGEQHAPRARLLLLPGRRLHLGQLPAHGRLHLLDRRRARRGRTARKVAGPISLSWIASTNQGVMVGDYMSTSFAGGNFAFPIFAVAKAKTGAVFDERAYSARFDVTLQPGIVRARHDRIRFSKHNLVPDLELPPVTK